MNNGYQPKDKIENPIPPTSGSNILDLLKLNLLNYQNMTESHGIKIGIQICLDEINRISNDVVEIIRCEKCKHIDLNSAEPIVCNGIASVLCRCKLHERSVRIEDFCSDGERKTDDEQ